MCEDARVRIEGKPDARWLDAIRRACEDLRAIPDSDDSARVRLVPTRGDLTVEVVLKDGRSTLRRVKAPAALSATLEALLSVPPAAIREEAPAPALDRPPLAAPPREPSPTVPPPPTPSFGMEIGGAVGGRVAAEGYLSAAIGGFAQLRANDWLFAMSARWEVIEIKSNVAASNFEMETVGAGLSMARRFRLDFGSIDLGASPRLLAETQSFESSSGEIANTQVDVRLGAFARAAFGGAPLRMFIEVDGELSPSRIRRSIRIDPELPPLPAWSAGLGIGVVWGAP